MTRCVIDITGADGLECVRTGIGRVATNLGRALLRELPDAMMAGVQLGRFRELPRTPGGTSNPVIEPQVGDLVLCIGAGWREATHLNALSDAKRRGATLVPLVYDLIPLLMPHAYFPGFAGIYAEWLSGVLGCASHILVPSLCTQKDLLDWRVDGNHSASLSAIEVVRLGDQLPRLETDSAGLPAGLAGRTFVLCVGTLEFRKNQATLLNAWRLLVANGCVVTRLVLVGRTGWLDSHTRLQVMHDPVLRDRVVILDDADDALLDLLYRHCIFTVFPSIYEGWGLPVAESLSYGKPCIASDTSAIREISPDLVSYVAALDVMAWANRIQEWIEQPRLVRDMSVLISQAYVSTSWEDAACAAVRRLRGMGLLGGSV